jgi:hypothetical protein
VIQYFLKLAGSLHASFRAQIGQPANEDGGKILELVRSGLPEKLHRTTRVVAKDFDSSANRRDYQTSRGLGPR